MSVIVTNNVQVGQSGTASDNFTLYQPSTPDGTIRLANGIAGAPTDLLTVTSAGNVGIGTASPSYKLHVSATESTAGYFTGSGAVTTIDLNNTNANGWGGNIAFRTGGTAAGYFGTIGSLLGTTAQDLAVYATTGNGFRVYTNGNNLRATIDTFGNLTVGPSTANSTLRADGAIRILNTANTSGFDIGLLGGSSEAGAYVYQRANSFMAFGTNNAERARIDASGNLLVGATATFGTSGKFYVLGASGQTFGSVLDKGAASEAAVAFNRSDDGKVMSFYRAWSGGGVGNISVTSTATTYNTSSDYRLKENVAPMQNALETVAQLKPCTYTWKADGSAGQGFIAHELQEVVPDCVTGEKDAVDAEGKPQYQGVDTSFLVATLVAAIQELKGEFDAYKAAHP